MICVSNSSICSAHKGGISPASFSFQLGLSLEAIGEGVGEFLLLYRKEGRRCQQTTRASPPPVIPVTPHSPLLTLYSPSSSPESSSTFTAAAFLRGGGV